jgi:hypothetical protein
MSLLFETGVSVKSILHKPCLDISVCMSRSSLILFRAIVVGIVAHVLSSCHHRITLRLNFGRHGHWSSRSRSAAKWLMNGAHVLI